MKRRSLLGFLLAAPVAAPAIVKAMGAHDGAVASFVVKGEPFVALAPRGVFTVATINGLPRIVIRGDMVADGSITTDHLKSAADVLRAQHRGASA